MLNSNLNILEEIYNNMLEEKIVITSTPKGENVFLDIYKENLITVEKAKFNTNTILIIPDCHIRSDDNFDRFRALDKLIIERKPDYIVQLGDFLGMSCLSHWDKNNKLKMEGVRYKSEIDAGNMALDLMFSSTNKSKTYNPSIVWCFGNHDQAWVERYLEQNPTLSGHIDIIEDLKLRKRGITNIVPYKKYFEIGGILVTHAPSNGAGQACGGKYSCQKASDLVSKSLVFGHTHSSSLYSCQRHGDDHLTQIYTAGCFFERDNIEEYAEDSTMPHWFGISILTNYAPGQFDIEQISIDRLKLRYL